MIEINVYNDIANNKQGVCLSMFGLENAAFSAETVSNIFRNNKTEKEFKFNIHCDGGSVSEGLAIYDIIRNSGKTIYTNIEGACHSMAVCILLAAPFQNRTANRNARALIHQVSVAPYDYLNADDLRDLANEIEFEQNTILDIYADRTGYDRTQLETLMKEEKQRTAQQLLDYGFISKINTYTTNKKKNEMSNRSKKTSLLNKVSSFVTRVSNSLGTSVNFDHTDENGDVLFSTEGETDALEVGMPATPDGTFDLPDGRTVIIVDGAISEIQEANTDDVENLRNDLAEAINLINALTETNRSLKNQIKSGYKTSNRIASSPKSRTSGANRTAEDYAQEIKDKKNSRQKKGNK